VPLAEVERPARVAVAGGGDLLRAQTLRPHGRVDTATGTMVVMTSRRPPETRQLSCEASEPPFGLTEAVRLDSQMSVTPWAINRRKT
jgi:hypothetical protein